MAWIESHQELAAHPKTKRLARGLGITVPAAIGHLHLLWWWALDYAQDGDLVRFEPGDIADACQWDKDADTLVSALRCAGFIDDGRYLHDWSEYAGRLLDQRAANAQRARTARERRAQRAPLPDQTVPNLTKPDRTEPDPPAVDAPTEPTPTTALRAPRKRAITPEAVSELQAEFPGIDVDAVAKDYLNWSGSAKHHDKVMGLRNQLSRPAIAARFPRNPEPYDGTAAFAGYRAPPLASPRFAKSERDIYDDVIREAISAGRAGNWGEAIELVGTFEEWQRNHRREAG